MDFDPQRICIIKPSALGDVAQTLPLLPVLQWRFPQASIAWVINRELSDLVAGHPDLDEVIPFDRHGGWREFWRLLRTLRSRRFDLVFDLQGLLRTGLMTRATGARWRVGLQTAREGAHLACNMTIPDTSRAVPAHERNWRVAEWLGLGEMPRLALVATTDADRAWVQGQLTALPRPVIGIHPGAKWETKRWPVEKFADVALRAMRTHGGSVVVVGGSGDVALGERIVQPITDAGFSAVNLAGRTSLQQLAGLLRSVSLLVSNDSGPLHLAAELGTPVVGVYTCTSPEISGPAGVGHELVATQVACAAGYHKVCPHRGDRHLACFEDLATDRVAAALLRILSRIAAQATSA
jgi:lipopolysaccharide heptosyltransferase II